MSRTHCWTVLVVDDSESARQLLRAYLEAEGYVVEEAADGVQAFVRLSRRETRYLVLLDYSMPELDGWGVLRLAAADPRLLAQHTYIVITAAEGELPDAFRRFLSDHRIPLVSKGSARREMLALIAQAAARLG